MMILGIDDHGPNSPDFGRILDAQKNTIRGQYYEKYSNWKQ